MMNNEDIIGSRLSFAELLSRSHIQIPIIQRDYAQGRNSEMELRNSFLDKLYDYLSRHELERDLDFVYGNSVEENGIKKFIPLDGQQRLTTLMLLHWYLSLRSGQFQDFAELALHRNEVDNYVISKFSYETRSSSRRFCNALFQTELNLEALLPSDVGKDNSVSKSIRNAHWFSLSWVSDPTVKGMLNMLDAIHKRFFLGSESFYGQLVNHNHRALTFLFLDLNEYNLSDDLYIKMNARGVTLSSFENFKANFEQYLSNVKLDDRKYILDFDGQQHEVSLQKYYAYQLDVSWSNIFWSFSNHVPENYDLYLTNLIRTMAIAVFSSSEYMLRGGKHEKLLEQLLSKSGAISFYSYNRLGLFNVKRDKLVAQDQQESELDIHNLIDNRLVDEMIRFLDVFKNRPTAENHFAKGFYFEENSILKTLFSTSYKVAEYGARVKFYAYYKYLITYSTADVFEDFQGISEWLRVVHNLVESTLPFDRLSGFLSAIRSIDLLLSSAQNILDSIAVMDGTLAGFDDYQWQEEKTKAKLILMDRNWKELFLQAEQHPYFNGQIGFLLFLSGVYSSKIILENPQEHDQQSNSKMRSVFAAYFKKAQQVFTKGGLRNSLSVDGNFIWERAFLSLGNYSLKESQNQSFLIGSDRDISWKRFLKLDKEEANGRRHAEILRLMFEQLDYNDIEGSLRAIIASRDITINWRERFIKNPSLFKYLGGKRYFREKTAHGFVLFKGERMSGGHAELISYDLLTSVFGLMEILPFKRIKYYFAGGEDINDRPCAYFDQWHYDNVHFALDVFGELDGRILLRYFFRDHGYFPQEMDQLLLSMGFEFIEKGANYFLRLNEEDIQAKLVELFESMRHLVITNNDQLLEV